jgi:ATP-binding cassette, subfamily B, bacterial
MNIPIKTYWQLLARYLQPQRGLVLLLAVLLFAKIGLQVLNPQIIRQFIDAAEQQAALSQLLTAGGTFLAFALLVQLLSVAATYAGERVGWVATNNLRADLALHSLQLDMTFHNNKTPGEMVERIDSDVMDLAIFFSTMVIQVAGSLVLLIAVLVAVALENVVIAAVLGVFSLAVVAALTLARSLAVPHFKVAREAHADLYGFLEEQLGGTEDIRSSGAGSYTLRRFFEAARKVISTESKAGVMGIWMWVFFQAFEILGRILAFLGSYLLWQNGAITLGTAFLLVYYIDTIFTPLRMLTTEIESFQKAGASIIRLRELQQISSKLPDTGTHTLPTGALGVAFEDVRFAYADGKPVLDAVSFALKPGRVLGVLGRTGSGKTTLARLIFRLYDVSAGAVKLLSGPHGIDVRDVPLHAVPDRVSMVTQDVQIFRATIRDNLTLFDRRVPDAQLLNVITELGLGDWLATQAKGLDTELDSGGKSLSAGEAQLLAFGRVFLRDPGLVVMDEASSRLDPATETRIEHAVDRLLDHGAGRTALIIAHRLATVMRADDILILDRGRIAEYGARETLMADPASRFSRLLRTAKGDVLDEELMPA